MIKNKKKKKKLKNWVLLGQNLMLINPAKPFDSYCWLQDPISVDNRTTIIES
jgi:hypothetical protein